MRLNRRSHGKTCVASSPEILLMEVHELIIKCAYELYAQKGYREDHALDVWLDAEREILGRAHQPYQWCVISIDCLVPA